MEISFCNEWWAEETEILRDKNMKLVDGENPIYLDKDSYFQHFF